MDAKVTVEEMASAVETLITFAGGLRAHGHGAVLVNALAARDYIIAAESQIAEAMTVLSPSMPESGLVDACRQVKQAAELRMPHVGNGRCGLCNEDSNLFRSPDDHLLCGDCRTAFRVGYKAAREAKVTQ